jgi:hypothetical protein
MPSKDVAQFVSLRDALVREKAELEARLSEINMALGGTPAPVTEIPAKRRGRPAGKKKAVPTSVVPKAAKKKSAGRRPRSGMSLPEAVLQVTAKKPLSAKEIVAAVQKVGYKFTTNNPMNSTRTMLYTNKKFKNNGGKFGPA